MSLARERVSDAADMICDAVGWDAKCRRDDEKKRPTEDVSVLLDEATFSLSSNTKLDQSGDSEGRCIAISKTDCD